MSFKDAKQAKLIGSWEQNDDFDLWNVEKSAFKYADVHLSPEALSKYSALFEMHDINYEIINNNLQK